MKKLFLVITAIICCVVSCKEQDKLPKGLYTKEEMAEVLQDIYLLEAKVKELNIPVDSAAIIYDHYEKGIFSKYQIDDSLYEISFEYYLNHPEVMSEIYAVMIDSLSLRERLYSNRAVE